MFGLRKTLGSIIMVVLFLALASLAAFFYNLDQDKQEEIANSDLAQKGQVALGTLMGVSESAVDVNLQKNIGPGKTIIDYIRKINWKTLMQEKKTGDESSNSDSNLNSEMDSEANSDNSTPGFWSKFAGLVQKEWSDNQTEENTQTETEEAPPVDQNEQKLFNYQKTETGAEIIFKAKNGADYKLPVPFKFLSNF